MQCMQSEQKLSSLRTDHPSRETRFHRGVDLLCRNLPEILAEPRCSGVDTYTACVDYRAISGKSARQSIACVRRMAPDRPRNNFRCRVSKASANTPPTNVKRNGSAHSQGFETVCVVTRGNRSKTITRGAVLPK